MGDDLVDNSTFTSFNGVLYTRTFAMPTPYPISRNKKVQATIFKYVNPISNVVVLDPFAGYGTIGPKFSKNVEYISNDLNDKFYTDYNLDFRDFLQIFPRPIIDDNKKFVVISDPPYSPEQLSKFYQSIDKKGWDGQSLAPKVVREMIRLQPEYYISLGWNSAGPKDTHTIVETTDYYHGGGRNDTKLVVWEKSQTDLFDFTNGNDEEYLQHCPTDYVCGMCGMCTKLGGLN